MFSGSEFVEPVPLNVCANLVINSKRERREKEEALKQRQLEEEEKNNEDAIDNVETANHLNKQTSEKVNPSADPSKTTQKAKRTTFNAAGRGNISNRGSKSKN